jgi:Putative peptidoglycan binding domain
MGTYTVKKGDTLISIAAEKGFRDWRSIWDHRGNDALRDKRDDPQVLADGDELFIPEKAPRPFSCETEQKHRFQLKPQPCVLCIYLRDELGEPFADRRYELTVEGRRYEGVTLHDGRVVQQIKPTDKTGELKLYRDPSDPKDTPTWKIQLGGLDPPGSVGGAQGRLKNLGYGVLSVSGSMDESTRAALKQFQSTIGYDPPTGELDERTWQALAAAHDRR